MTVQPAPVNAEPPVISVVTPAFNERDNLPVLQRRLGATLAALGQPWEWIVVDDHSADDTFALVREWSEADPRITAVRLARNVGSHAALACGLAYARGRAVVLLSADLQDPPETLAALHARWREGAKVVWGLPLRPAGGLRRLFYALLRGGEGLADQPLAGGDMVLVDRQVVGVLNSRQELHSSLFARIRRCGFEQVVVPYGKARRNAGRSGWSTRKKLKLAIDSFTAFNPFLVRTMTVSGLLSIASATVVTACIATLLHRGTALPDWAIPTAALLLLCGMQFIFLGVLGEYAWRTLEEVRRRPLYTVEQDTRALEGHAAAAAADEP